MSGLFGATTATAVSVGWSASTSSSSWSPITLSVHGMVVTFEEAQFILEQQFTKEEVEKMIIAYTLTKKTLESNA
jgi:hypothetical protein